MHKLVSVIHCLVTLTMVTSTAFGQEPGAVVDHSPFDAILKRTIRDEGVDYLVLRRDHIQQLGDYLDQLARTRVDRLDRDEQLAFYINLYNATVIEMVARRYKSGYSVSHDRFGMFKEPLVRLHDRTVSLNDLENEIIRPTFKEPLIHVALVCAARSCRPIQPRAHRPDGLAETLDGNMRRFLNDARRNRIDPKGRNLQLSRIFEWYAEDFGGTKSLGRYVDKYVAADTTKAKIDFLEYSWDLNIVVPTDGEWVTVKTAKVTLYDELQGKRTVGSVGHGEILELLAEEHGWARVRQPLDGGDGWLPQNLVEPFRIAGP